MLQIAVIGTLLLSAFTVSAQEMATQTGFVSDENLTVPLYKSRVLPLSAAASRVSVGNPDIADILILRASQIYILGKLAACGKVSSEPIIVRAVTLEVSPKQAETLVLARTEGQIQLTLRNPMQSEPGPEVVAKPAPKIPSRKRPTRPTRPTSTTVTVIRGTKVEKVKTKT